MDGIINIYKEAGYTSFDVVAKLRGILKQKKIGHTGTLDPDAEGVLPVCLGKATKICAYLTEQDKVYRAVLHLGIVTDTQDISGTVLKEQEVTVTEEKVREVITGFCGTQKQVPPMYSALKVNGKKLCDLARQGIEVERKAREITVYSIRVEQVSLPFVTMEVHCSKGTYIRTLCQDIGEKLGCGGCMEHLLRTKTAGFTLEDALRLSEVEAVVHGTDEAGRTCRDIILPVDAALGSYPEVSADPAMDALLHNGGKIPLEKVQGSLSEEAGQLYRMYDSRHRFVGLFVADYRQQCLKPEKMFYQE